MQAIAHVRANSDVADALPSRDALGKFKTGTRGALDRAPVLLQGGDEFLPVNTISKPRRGVDGFVLGAYIILETVKLAVFSGRVRVKV